MIFMVIGFFSLFFSIQTRIIWNLYLFSIEKKSFLFTANTNIELKQHQFAIYAGLICSLLLLLMWSYTDLHIRRFCHLYPSVLCVLQQITVHYSFYISHSEIEKLTGEVEDAQEAKILKLKKKTFFCSNLVI